VKKIILRLQIWFRIRKRKKAFLTQMQGKCRPMKVTIHSCFDIVCLDVSKGSSLARA
jgi:hypothetical protein